jgi:hypothetical protein
MQTGAYSDTVEERRAPPTLRRTATPGIYKRGRRYYVVYRDPAGRQRKKSLATLTEARAFKSAVATAVYLGEYVPDPEITFAE